MTPDAAEFLSALVSSKPKPVTFQTYDDSPQRKGSLVRILHGTLAEKAAELDDLNSRGAGVFVTVNATDLKGRCEENVIGLRALFVDYDGPQTVPWAIEPSIQVASGSGPHAYWLLGPLEDLKRFTAAQKQLAAYYSSDPKVSDLPRVMRLPGTLWRKQEPCRQVTLLNVNSARRLFTIDELLEAHPVAAAPEIRRNTVREPRPISHEPGNALWRASQYLKEIPAAISGQGGHTQTFEAAVRIARGFSLSEDDAFELLWNEYNPRCQPQWNERELRHKVTDAIEKSTREGGWLLNAPFEHTIRHSSNGSSPHKETEEPEPSAEPILEPSGVSSNVPPETPTTPDEPQPILRPAPIRLADFLRLPKRERSWIVPGMIPAGGIGVLAAEAYMGKSTLLAQLAVSVAAGMPWLGFDIPSPGVALYWQAEGQPELFAQRIACGAFHLGISTEQLESLDVWLPPTDFLSPFDAAPFRQFIIDSKANLVVCDTAFFFTEQAREDSADDWKRFIIKPLKAIARETGAAFFLTHHYSKPSELRTGVHRVRGSSAMMGDCDFVFRLEGDSSLADMRTLVIDKVKDAPQQEDVRIVFDKNKAIFLRAEADQEEPVSQQQRPTKASVDKERQAETKRLALVDKAEKGILALLKRFEDGLSYGKIFADLHMNRDAVNDARDRLVDQFKIRSAKVGTSIVYTLVKPMKGQEAQNDE